MARYDLPYGTGELSLNLPDEIPVDVYSPREIHPADNPVREVENALENPCGGFQFERFRSARSVAIAINDKTRPVPHDQLLRPLLKKLSQIGIDKQAIRFIIATGTHLPMEPHEFGRILPQDILNEYQVESHNINSNGILVNLGYTQRGTPISINRHFFEADLKIVTGDIEPHHFMGFSGGVKSAAIGLAGRETINSNHAMLIHPLAISGHYLDNPMRQDVEEIGDKIKVHLALNAILNSDKQIVRVLAGEPRSVMKSGIPICAEICQVSIPALHDLVIASPGGHPKDINFYQSQKGLTHASLLARDGATVILAAACPEGVGSQSYADWMVGMKSHADVFTRFSQEGFRVGPHKAFQVAKIASRIHFILVSEMPPELVERLLIHPSTDLQNAVDSALSHFESPPKIAILPRAVNTIPLLSAVVH